ncbi:class I SAM-dependent DNA methyltransferase [Streptomyces anulatus]|uniref:class I SAM-dependent DNA methyltransferase n=1 Tax=Streptomyces anulatus TaxID=1892 RepID=UPI002E814F57|nr:class I SAM-dependent DNA methyltransferase [Streptomyces anulatus]WUC89276.1 class I SAM-dependent DNA methyltransferase [Streptomyces anulatus]
MTYDSLVNRGDYFSPHYLAEVLPKDLKSGLLAEWKQRESEAGDSADPEGLPVTPRAGLRSLRRSYFRARSFFALPEEREATEEAIGADDSDTYASPAWRERVHILNGEVLRAFGYDAKPGVITVERADHAYEVSVAHSEQGLIALDCGWSAEADDALDPDGVGRLLSPLVLNGQHELTTGAKLASFLFACEDAPRYVLLLVGGVVVLADRAAWGEGRYLAVSLDAALERNDAKVGGELDTVAALFGADSLRTPPEGGENTLAELVDKSTKHAVGVSSELRDGLRTSIELIANEVLERLREQGVRPEQVKELPELGRQLTRESLRYLYRILFLLYAEARPELGILPSDYPEYQQGYGLGRLGELVADRDLTDEKARQGVYLYESLDLLFRKVQEGHRPRRTHGSDSEAPTDKTSEDVGLRFEPLHSQLFEPSAIKLIGEKAIADPRNDADESGEERFLDTRLCNATLYRVLRLLMLTRGSKGQRGGFISYAQLGINQLGAVYEGLMSYSGFVANEELYEVAKNGDASGGSWLVPASKADEYQDAVFVRQRDEDTGEERRVRYAAGSFVYRLSGRDRQTSASYYTPESLTKVTVQLALQHRLDQGGAITPARELLEWKICEPALGSGAFLNEAINQVAAEYLRRRQDELGTPIGTESYAIELQKAKAYIALHNSYGVDLNSTAVELAEVSLWLNTMHPGMEAPWFGLHLRRGNSLIGGRREVYSAEKLKKAAWLGTTPERFPLQDAKNGLPVTITEKKTRSGETQRQVENAVHHFLLPAKEWGAVASEKEARNLAPEAAKALATWRKLMTRTPTSRQSERLQGLARRAEYLWQLVVRRLEISERDISRRIDVWGTENGWLRAPVEAVPREEVLADLEAVDTPYWRLKTLMDAWCALWFWPVQEAGLLDGSDVRYRRAAELAEESAVYEAAVGAAPSQEAVETEDEDGVLMAWEVDALPGFTADPKQLALTRERVEKRRTGRRKEAVKEQRRAVIPLAGLDDWIDFAEALLGTQDVPAESLVSGFESLSELTPYEDALPDLMGMDRSYWLESRFPWAATARDIALQQGFFHWELEYSSVFAGGGYDLQVGNPPWVRPDWDEASVFAELEPWFKLAEKPSAAERRLRRDEALTDPGRQYVLDELCRNAGTVEMLSSPATFPLMAHTRPNLYRAFMCQVWTHASTPGMTGLVHPDTHLEGVKDGRLRAAAYRHLRLHATFINSGNWAFEIGRTVSFGLHIYGCERRHVDFETVSQLHAAQVLPDSLKHDGSGDVPTQKYNGTWDVRPHRSRIVRVTDALLAEWQKLGGDTNYPVQETQLLHSITTAEQEAIIALASVQDRLGQLQPLTSSGYNEATAKTDGIIRYEVGAPSSWDEAILQGTHFAIATPFAKRPNLPMKNAKDWIPWDLRRLPSDSVPRTTYVRACGREEYESAQDHWAGTRYTQRFRLAWRRMIDPKNTERSLFAALLPPGPAHVHTVHSMALGDNQSTALNAGFWAALPVDYLLRITGRSDLQFTEALKMPAAIAGHPLATPLLLRTLRLNCLTDAYAPLWQELFNPTWPHYEDWSPIWPNLAPLSSHLTSTWEVNTPLRTEYERRAALVELDALVSVWLGITADQLAAIYKSRYAVLADREAAMYFDATGRRISADPYAYGYGQTKQDYLDLLDHLENPSTTSPPAGHTAPFYKADRVTEMRAAHVYFQNRLDAEIAAGRWTTPSAAHMSSSEPGAQA